MIKLRTGTTMMILRAGIMRVQTIIMRMGMGMMMMRMETGMMTTRTGTGTITMETEIMMKTGMETITI